MTATTEGIALAVETLTGQKGCHLCRGQGWFLVTLDPDIDYHTPAVCSKCFVRREAHEATRADCKLLRDHLNDAGNWRREAHAKLAASDADWAEVDRLLHEDDCVANRRQLRTIAASHRPEPEVDVLVEAMAVILGPITARQLTPELRAELAKRGVIIPAGGGV